jgi:parallel beta-helix repeat protein
MRVRKLNPRRRTLTRPGPGWAARASAKGGYAPGVAAAALLAAVAVALLAWLVVIPATRVQAATYTVNVTTDGDDLAIDGVCDSDAAAGEQCSLRAAIEEANASGENDVIVIGVAGPVVLVGGLPTITDPDLIITGEGQRVSLTVPGVAFVVNADGVQMNDLVIDGEGIGTTGVRATAATDDLMLEAVTVRDFTGNGIEFLGGENSALRDSAVTDNDDNGLRVTNTDDLVVQGNTFSGNSDAQILVDALLSGQDLLIIQNTIVSGSNGIVIGASVNAGANIDIGLSYDNRNVFRGTLGVGEYHLIDLAATDIDAEYNDWHNYDTTGIEGVICHDADTDPNCPAGTGPGIVDFEPFITTESPLPTATPLATVTPTTSPATATPTETPTATPGGVQTVPLTAGCNPVAWTGSDNTPVATIGSAVSPAGIVVSVWELEAGVWAGYSPLYPEASQAFNVDRLGVVFICVSTPGTLTRPAI